MEIQKIQTYLKKSFWTTGVVACVVLASPFSFANATPRIKTDSQTSFLIEAKDGKIVDSSGRIADDEIVVKGVEVEKDPVFGEVMVPKGNKCSVVVPDLGKISFKGGATLEAWVMLLPGRTQKAQLANKDRSCDWQKRAFEVHLSKGNRLSSSHYCTNPETIDFTEDEKKHHWGFRPDNLYGGLHFGTNGNTPVSTGVWVHVAWTYDEKRALVRTWVDGSIDREFFEREPMISRELADVDAAPVTLFSNATGIKIAQVRLSEGPRVFGRTPPVRVFIHESPYWKKGGYVHIKPVSDRLPLPVDVEVMNVHQPFFAEANRVTLTSTVEAVNIPIPKHDFNNARSDLVIKVKKGPHELWRQEFIIGNPAPCSAEMADFYSGKTPYPAKQTVADWGIGADNTIYYKKKPYLPLHLYFVRPQHWDLVTELGFNMISFRSESGMKRWDWEAQIKPYYAKAAEKGITLTAPSDQSGRPGQGFIFAFDEPYGYTFERLRHIYLNYRSTRNKSSQLPIISSQNNQTRYRETSMCCDILAPDPYNKGRSPLRNIYDAICGAVIQVDDRKPIMSIIGNYGTDKYRPDPEELRTMCYLSFVGGARALSFYSWDEGDKPGGPMDTSLKPGQVEAYRKLFKEFKVLEPALTTPNVKGVVSVEPAQPRGFFPCVKKGRDKKVYLFVASDLYRSTTKTIVMPSAAGKEATLLFGPWRTGTKAEASTRLVFDAEGKAQLTLPPVSSAVYVFKDTKRKGKRK